MAVYNTSIKPLPFVMTLKNIYDYAEYKDACIAIGRPIESWLSYVQIVETLLKGIETYPELHPTDAYYKIIKDNNNSMIAQTKNNIEETMTIDGNKIEVSECTPCGGGKVR